MLWFKKNEDKKEKKVTFEDLNKKYAFFVPTGKEPFGVDPNDSLLLDTVESYNKIYINHNKVPITLDDGLIRVAKYKRPIYKFIKFSEDEIDFLYNFYKENHGKDPGTYLNFRNELLYN